MRIAALALLMAGCAEGDLEVEHEGSVEALSAISAFAFATLGDLRETTRPDLVVGDRERGQLIVYAQTEDGLALIGSFPAGGPPLEIVPAYVARQTVLLVRVGDAINLVASDPHTPHALAYPVRIAAGPGLRAMAAGDLDGDGSDDLAAASGLGVGVAFDLATAIGGDPEHPPALRGVVLDAAFIANSVAITDVDGDHIPDVVAAQLDGAHARIYHEPTSRMTSVGEIALPDLALAIAATTCAYAPVQVLLRDGRTTALTAERAPRALAPIGTQLQAFASAHERLAGIDRELGVVLHDACRERVQPLHRVGTDAAAVALSPMSREGQRDFAVLARDQHTVQVYRLSGEAAR